MVKRKRLASSAEDKNSGMTVEGSAGFKDASKRPALTSTEGTCSNTRSKHKLSVTNDAQEEVEPETQCTLETENVPVTKKAGPTLRTSARTHKPAKRDPSPPVPVAPKNDKSNVVTTEQVKRRRAWELWSAEDKKIFFEALCEYGKDFESIQHHLAQKSKKKNQPSQMIRNKDQVRHFYYRTWHKINKYLHISDDVKKPIQELYGLINYGELRKKLGGRLDERNGQKLNELVFTGATTIRVKGKNTKLKTPVCRALKKLNNVEDIKEEESLKVPAKVVVELRPINNAAWTRVQSLAQNPRIKVSISTQKRLSSLIEYFERRWRPHRLKLKEQLHFSLGSDCVSKCEHKSLLRFIPPKDSKITLVSMRVPDETVTCETVSLSNYQKNVFESPSSVVSTKKQGKKSRVNSVANDDKDTNKRTAAADDKLATKVSKIFVETEKQKDDSFEKHPADTTVIGADVAKEESSSMPAHEITLRHLLALQSAATCKARKGDDLEKVPDEDPATSTPTCSPSNTAAPLTEVPCKKGDQHTSAATIIVERDEIDAVTEESKVEETNSNRIEEVRRGWTVKAADKMLIGELFLLLGNPNTLLLEYNWDPEPVKVSEESDISKQTSKEFIENAEVKLKAMLSRLIRMASTQFNEKKDKANSTSSPCRRSLSHSMVSSSVQKAVSSRSPAGVRQANKPAKSVNVCSSKMATTTAGVTAATTTATVTTVSSGKPQNVFLVPTNTAPQSRAQANKHSTTNEAAQQNKNAIADKAFKEQLDKFLPLHRKAKGRVRKSVVVQRELPLLPKKTTTHSMMTFQFVPSGSQLGGSFVPVLADGSISAVPITTDSALTKVVKIAPHQVINSSSITVKPTVVSPIFSPTNPVPSVSTAGSSSSIGVESKMVTASLGAPMTSETVILPVTSSTFSSVAENTVSTTTLLHNSIQTPSISSLSGVGSRSSVVESSGNNLKLDNPNDNAEQTQSVPSISIPETSAGTFSTSSLSMSSFLDISLPGCEGLQSGPLSLSPPDKLLDISLGSSNSGFSVFNLSSTINEQPSPSKTGCVQSASLNAGLHMEMASSSTAPFTPSFKGSSNMENPWINGESGDISLSSLLRNLESPVKSLQTASSASNMQETLSLDPIGRLASDVDTQLQCMMNENSVDYVAKFADLAAQIATNPGTENSKEKTNHV